MKVNFMIIGAMKCGTTTLSKILANHPSISFSKEKEPHFFSKSKDWKSELKDYEKLFSQKDGVIYGEGSTTYTFYPQFNLEVWNDIYEYNPDMKFIYLIRNPIERIISQYMHSFERGYINTSIEEAILNHPPLLNNARYYSQITPYIEKFGISQVLVLDFDDLIHAKEKTIQKVSSFLDIDFAGFKDFEAVHALKSVGGNKIPHKYDNLKFLKEILKFLPKGISDFFRKMVLKSNQKRTFLEKPTLSPKLQNVIRHFLKLEIEHLNKIIDKDISYWLEES